MRQTQSRLVFGVGAFVGGVLIIGEGALQHRSAGKGIETAGKVIYEVSK